jgi:5-hydroxyisourate hydrolase-like protein (transthyretin family)
MKRIALIITLFVIALTAMAQKTLSGTILSKTDGQPVEMATVRLFEYKGADSTLVQGAQTYYDGLFILSNIRPGRYKLIVSSVGFNEQSQWVEMKQSDLDIPAIRLVEQVQELAEVSVQGRQLK